MPNGFPPVSNKQATQFNEFLKYFNEKAATELPKDDQGNPRWDLLDTNTGWEGSSYSGGQDYSAKKFDEFIQSKGYTGEEDLKSTHIPQIQSFYTDIYNAAKNEPEYMNYLNVALQSEGLDPATWNPAQTLSGKSNTDAWIGTQSRHFYLPTQTGPFTESKENVLLLPKSLSSGGPEFTDYKGGFGVVYQPTIPPSAQSTTATTTTTTAPTSSYRQIAKDSQEFEELKYAPTIQKEGKILKKTAKGEIVEILEKGGPLNFKNKEAYDKWVAYGHIHGVFDKPGNQKVSIGGKNYTVDHKKAKGGSLSPTKARIMLHEGVANGKPITDKQRRFFGAVASGYIKWKGGKLYAGEYEQGGKMCYEDGGDVEYEEDDIKALEGGELEDISEDVVEVKGHDHDMGGVKLNTGDEVEGGETIDKKKEIVYSDTLIDPITKKTFAEAHKEMAKEMRKLERGTERWEKRKLAMLKEKAEGLYNRQQEMNGDENTLEGGGNLGGDGPGAGELLASKQDRYFKVDQEEYTVSAKDADAFLKQFPTAKEYKKVGENFIEATSPLLAVGQKKNKLGEATTVPPVKDTPSTDWDDLKTLLPEQQSDISNAPTIYDQLGGMDMTQHKEALKEKYQVVKDDFNDWIEPLIGEQRKEMVFDVATSGFDYSPFGIIKPIVKDKIQPSYSDNVQSIIDQENPEDIRLWTGAARQRRDDVNMMIGNKLIDELMGQEEAILISEEQKVGYARQGPKKEINAEYQGKGDPRTIFPENVETSFGFDVALEDLFNKYKGQKIELPDGTVFDTNKITPSQLREIDAYVKGNYQIYKNYQASTKVAEQKVNNILSGNVDENDPGQKVASEIVNSGVVPASPETWDSFFKGMDQVNKESALLETNLITSLKRDQEASQLAYQEEVTNFVNSAFPEVEKYQKELQDQVNNGQIDADQANQLLQVYKDKIQQKETELYDKWNKKINADAQRKIKMIYDSREQKVKNLLEGTVLQGVDLTKVNKEYIDQSTKAFSDLVMGEMGRLEQTQSEFLNMVSYDNYMNKGWGDKIATELGRGVLQMGDSMGGLIGFLGGFEAQNTLNDGLARYNAANPQYNSGSIKMSDFSNPDFYITNLVPQLPMAAVFTGLAIGTGGVAGGIAAEAGVSGIGRTAIMGVSGAYASRPFESALEAGADFNEQIKNGVAVEVAAKNSADTFNQNMNLLFTDIGQLMLAFTPLGKIKGVGAAVLKAPVEAAIQGGEEIYQGYITQHNPYQTLLDYAISPQGIKEGVIGGMMGLAYSAPDVAAQFTGRTDKWKQNLLYEMLQAPDMGKRYQDVLQGLNLLKERGQIDEQAYTDAISKLEFAYTKGQGIPVNLPIEQKTHMLGILSDINVLEQQKAQMTDQTQIKTHDNLIKDLQKQYEETLSGKSPLYFVGKVSYSKEEFQQLIQNPDVIKQLAEKSTTFKVINDEGVLGDANNLIKQYEDSQNREGTDDSVIKGGATVEGQLDTGASPEEDAAIDKAEQQDQVEEDLLEEDFPVEEYEPITFEGPTNYERALDNVTLYASENKIDLSEEQIEEVAAILDENPDANIQHIIEDITNPILYETANGRYQYVKTEEGVKLLDTSGKEAKLSSKQRMVYDREFASNAKLSKEDQQLLEEYSQEEDLIKQTITPEDIIGEILSSGIKQSDWDRYGDKNKTTGSIARAYFRKDAPPLDTRIAELSEQYFGDPNKIQIQDVIDFIEKYPSGPSKQQSAKKGKLKEIEGKFQESTGVSIQRFKEKPTEKGEETKKVEEKLPTKEAPEAKEEKTYTEKAKKLADKIRKLKGPKLTDENGNDIVANDYWSEAVELAAVAIEQSGKVADGIVAAIKHIKKQSWYKKLTEDQQIRVDNQVRDHIKKAFKKKKRTQPIGTTETLTKVKESTVTPEPVKEKFEEKYSKYKPKSVAELSENATKAWEEIKSRNDSIEEAVLDAENAIKSRDWKGDEEEQAALAVIVARELFGLRNKPGISIEQIEDYDSRAADLLGTASKELSKAAGFTARVGRFMADMLIAYPEGIVQHVQKAVDDLNDSAVPVNDTTSKTIAQIFEELLSTEEGQRVVKDYAIRQGLIKQKYKNRKEAVDAYLDAAFSDEKMLMSTFLPITPEVKKVLGAIVKGVAKSSAYAALSVAEKVELVMQKFKDRIQGNFDEQKIKTNLQYIFENAEKFADDWQKGTPNKTAIKTVQERIDQEYQKRIKALQEKENSESELKEKDAEGSEIQQAVNERIKAYKDLKEFEEGLAQLKGDKLRSLVEKVAKEFIKGKSNFTPEDIRRGIQQVNGGFGLSQRQMSIVDKNAKLIVSINDKIKNTPNISQQEFIKLNHQAQQASSQIMKMLAKRDWLDLLQGMKIAGYFTAKTLISNVVSNYIFSGFRRARDIAFSPVTWLFEPNSQRKGSYIERVKQRFSESVGGKGQEASKEQIKSIPGAFKIAGDIVKKGIPMGEVGKVSSKYDVKGWEAWRDWSESVSKNPKTLSKINEASKIFLEGTIGNYATYVLRGLNAGDALITVPEKAKLNQIMANYLNVPLDMFLKDPQFKDWREEAEELAAQATFQQKENILNWIWGKAVKKKNQDTLPIRIATFLVGTSIAPFKSTPVNIISEAMRLIPGFQIPQLIWHSAKAHDKKLSESKRFYHQRLAQKNAKYLALSIPLYLGIKALIESGILEFPEPPEEKDKKKRAFRMAYEGAPTKMRINIPGLEGVSLDIQKIFGPLGTYALMVNASVKSGNDNIDEILMSMLEKAPSSILENTFFTGINQVFQSIQDKNYKKLLMDVLGPNTNVLLPNIMADITRLSDDDKYVRLLKDDKFWPEFYNRYVRNKIGFLPIKSVESEGLKPKYNIWGEPIKTDVEGQPDWFHYLFDFTRAEDVDPEKQEHFFIYKNFMKSKDSEWLPPMASKDFKYEYSYEDPETLIREKEKIDVHLSEELLNEYQRILGQTASGEINALWENKENWSEGQVEPTLKQVNKAYDRASDKAKRLFYEEFKEKLGVKEKS